MTEHCIIMAGDASDCGGGDCMWRVKIPDARQVQVPQDLMDPELTQLIYVDYSVLSKEDLRNLIYENELKRTVKSLKKRGGVLIMAMAGYKADKTSADYVCKCMVYTDSMTALGAGKKMVLPQGKLEFVTAKSRKIMGWSNDVAFTTALAMEFQGIPGVENNLCDFLSHLSDAMVRQDRLARDAEATMNEDYLLTKLVCPMTRHQVRELAEADTGDFEAPGGWDVVEHNFTDAQWHVVCDAYKADDSTFLKMKLSEVYEVLTAEGNKVAQLHKERILSWKQRVFAVAVCKDGTPALFVPRSFLRLDDDDDEEPVVKAELVLLVPEGAQVKITTADVVYDAEAEGEMQLWMKEDLRTDYVLMAHEYSLHARWHEMWSFISERAWWPAMAADIKKHMLECGLCNAKAKAYRLAGYGLVALVLYRHICMDHKEMPDWLYEKTGVKACLTFYCRGGSVIDAACVGDLKATTSALALYNTWIRRKGLMRTLSTDQGSGFTSAVMKTLLAVLGVKVHNMTAVANSEGLGGNESINNVISGVIAEIDAKGDVSSRQELEAYITTGLMKYNMVTRRADGGTLFELEHGRPARTVADAIACVPDIDLGSLKATDKQTVQLLAARQEDMLSAMRVQKDEQARRSAMRLDSEHQAARVHDFGLSVNDEASLQNNDGGHVKVKIVSMDKEGNSATVTLASNGSSKKVQVTRLRPLAAQKCERLVTKALMVEEMAVGDLCIWQEAGTPESFGGLVVELMEGGFEVHEHAACDTGRSWVPSWRMRTGKQVNQKVCPAWHSAVLKQVLNAEVVCRGELTGTGFVSEVTMDRMKALGIV